MKTQGGRILLLCEFVQGVGLVTTKKPLRVGIVALPFMPRPSRPR